MTLSSSRAVRWFAVGALLCMTPAWAGEEHDHGDAPAAATGTASPRFTAVSEAFELVGVLNGKQLTLYLDRYADNSPVPGAQLELEIGGVKVPVEPDAMGAYQATLTEVPKPGVTPVTATVIADADTDLLAGELDLHEEAHADEAGFEHPWQNVTPWAVGALLVIAVLAWRVRRVQSARSVQTGGAA
ncbi:MAG: hypothetical protein WCJ87_07770 [Burkholderiales bacterium]